MRIIQLTPGTGSFYCGSCVRDNALVTALRQLGHDAVMVPMYLPLMLDEPNAAAGSPLFFGGINVYLQQKSALFRKTPAWIDRVFDAPALLASASRKSGMTSARDLGELTLSMLRGENGNQAKELAKLTTWMARMSASADNRPAVIHLSNALLIGAAHRLSEATGARIVCSMQGEDSFLDSLPEPQRRLCWEEITAKAEHIDAFIAASEYFAGVMQERLQLPPGRVHVVPNGMRYDDYTIAATAPQPQVLGYLARMCRSKGLSTLVDAFILLRQRANLPDLRLRVAGTQTGEDSAFVADLQARLRAHGLDGDAEFLPDIDRAQKLAFLRSLSVLSVPATYGEAFGLYVLEALAAGVPVVQPRHAAFPELIAATGGGRLCEPDDPASLALTVEQLLADPDEARRVGARGREAVLRDFTAERMAQNAAAVFAQCLSAAVRT